MTARSLGAVTGVLAALACAPPALAAPAAPWYDVVSGAPATVDFSSVAALRTAAGKDVVVAVGRDRVERRAVIYRLAGGRWQEDAVSGAATDSCLQSIALTETAAWAVGSQSGGCGAADPASEVEDPTGPAHALIVRFPVESLSIAEPAEAEEPADPAETDPVEPAPTWVTLPAATVAPLPPLESVSLSGSAGYVAAGNGAIYRVTDGPAPVIASIDSTPDATAIAGVAVYGSGGFAVGESAGAVDPVSQVFTLAESGVAQSPSATGAPAATSEPLAGVAAIGDSAALAVEQPAGPTARPQYLYRQDGLWKRTSDAEFPVGSEPHAVAMTGTGTSVTEAVAGERPVGGVPTGVVWLRTGSPAPADQGGWNWARTDGLGEPLHGVAVLSEREVWAVGENGTVLRYDTTTPPPADPPPTGGGDDDGDPPQQTPPGDGGGSTERTPTASDPPADGGPSSAPPPAVVVDQPPPAPPSANCPKSKPAPSRLLEQVKVSVRRGRLIVSFRLNAEARVRAEARTGRRLVGSGRARVMKKGPGRLVIRYRGKRPPKQLRIIARPVKSNDACGGKR